MLKEILHFLLHLRLHYQLFILSGGYLLGGLMADQMDTSQFWLQFLNVHILLFGGATAFNSFWDKDEGPIGGLKNPPKMTTWMHRASLVLMFLGWLWAYSISIPYFIIYGLSLVLFWLYSTPHARWKGDPHLSMIAISVSTGMNSTLLGFLATNGAFSLVILFASVGTSFVLLSLYPVSQIYQQEEDQRRGDITFFGKYGLSGVKRFFKISYPVGLSILFVSLISISLLPGLFLFFTGTGAYVYLLKKVNKLEGLENEYRNVMKLKFIASLSFVLFLLSANAIKYEWIGHTFLTNYF